jgi:hypothetical protein
MTTSKSEIGLPPGVQAMGLSEEEAARFYGVSPSTFATLDRALKPRARRVGNCKRYSRAEAEEAFHRLPFWEPDHDGGASDELTID